LDDDELSLVELEEDELLPSLPLDLLSDEAGAVDFSPDSPLSAFFRDSEG